MAGDSAAMGHIASLQQDSKTARQTVIIAWNVLGINYRKALDNSNATIIMLGVVARLARRAPSLSDSQY